MIRSIILLSLLLLSGCQMNQNTKQVSSIPFYVGTYTEAQSQGIYKYLLDQNGALKLIGLAAHSENPSFLAMSSDKKFLVAVNETHQLDGQGSVESFQVTDDSLIFLSRSPSGGAHPCFVAVNTEGFVLTANYTGGNVGLLKLKGNGMLSGLLDVQQHSGSGTTNRQQAPHAHSAWFVPGENEIIAVDLGTNELWFSKLDTVQKKLIPEQTKKLRMQPGAGPRHLTFHPNGKWIYVVNEINSTVSILQKTAEKSYEIQSSISTLPPEFSDSNTCAHIAVSADGKFVYASNRGHNSIAIFAVDLQDGSLKQIGHESTRGDGPRNFALSPDDQYILVANQHTANIVSFKRNPETGLLKFVSQTKAPTPVCILF